jgi:hypothetical protein
MMFQSSSVSVSALECPSDTTRRSFVETSGGVSAWCARANDLKHGPHRSYYSNGQLLSEGAYADGAAHGTAVYYLNDGTVWRRDTWSEGALISKWLNPETMALTREELVRRGGVDLRDDVGPVIACAPADRRQECAPAPRNPVVVLRDAKGRRRARGAVSDGLRTDQWTYWYASGAPAKRAEFLGGELSGTYQEWYENGRPAMEGQYLSGEKVGVWLYWSRTGKIRRARASGRLASPSPPLSSDGATGAVECVRADDLPAPPRKIHDAKPDLYDLQGIQMQAGALLFDAMITPSGGVTGVRLVSDGHMPAPWPTLIVRWRSAISEWRYEPVIVNNMPVSVCMTVTVSVHVK